MEQDTGGEAPTVERLFDSTLESVDSAESLVVTIARQAGFQEDALDQIAMAVRECAVNAVVHGNRYSAAKKVRLSASKTQGRITVTIADQGSGFNPDDLPDPLAEENLLRASGRGIFLVRAFMDEFRVRRLDPEGTEVTLVKYLGAK